MNITQRMRQAEWTRQKYDINKILNVPYDLIMF
jgi:hypothetical protein